MGPKALDIFADNNIEVYLGIKEESPKNWWKITLTTN